MLNWYECRRSHVISVHHFSGTFMRVLHSPNSSAHQPERYFRRGAIVPHPEQAVRYRRLRDVVLADGHDLMHAGEFGLGADQGRACG